MKGNVKNFFGVFWVSPGWNWVPVIMVLASAVLLFFVSVGTGDTGAVTHRSIGGVRVLSIMSAALSLVVPVLAVFGKTSDRKRGTNRFKQLTPRGWLTILASILLFFVHVVHGEVERELGENDALQVQSKLDKAHGLLGSSLSMLKRNGKQIAAETAQLDDAVEDANERLDEVKGRIASETKRLNRLIDAADNRLNGVEDTVASETAELDGAVGVANNRLDALRVQVELETAELDQSLTVADRRLLAVGRQIHTETAQLGQMIEDATAELGSISQAHRNLTNRADSLDVRVANIHEQLEHLKAQDSQMRERDNQLATALRDFKDQVLRNNDEALKGIRQLRLLLEGPPDSSPQD